MTSAVIETQDIQKTYRSIWGKPAVALQGVSLRVEPGTIFGLIGQNGAGKTSLVKILLGLSTPTSGTAELLGSRAGDPVARRRVGYLPEQMRIPEYFKAEGFLRYMGKLNKVDSATLNRRIPALLEQVGLSGLRKPVQAYSKGMQQRLGLAQALVNDPEVLFLDEPTDGLDPMGRKDVRDLLTTLRAAGKTIFLNSHLLSEIELVCDRIAILNKGKVACEATPDEFTRGTGEYVVRVATINDKARAAVAAVMAKEDGRSSNRNTEMWIETTLRFTPSDRGQLNAVLDQLRAAPVEIESVEPVKLSLEEFFLQVVGGSES